MSLPFPREIPSAVTDNEATKLLLLAENRVVLELGAHYGFSTIVLAQGAKEFHSVDWHKGDDQAGHADNLLTFRENLRRHGVEDRVIVHVGRFEDVLPLMRPAHFDVCFVDGSHDLESVVRDLELAEPLVKPGGWIAVHDYGRFDVQPVVDRFVKAHGCEVEIVDWLAVVRKPGLARTDVDHFRDKGHEIKGVVHVGANDGAEIPLYLAAGCEPILAFEPHVDAFSALVGTHGRHATCVNVALGEETGIVALNLPSDGDTEKASKYLPLPTEGHDWTKVPYSYDNDADVIRFDEWVSFSGIDLSHYNCLVVDVQGMELEVLRGCGDALHNFDFLVVECSKLPMYDGEPSADAVVEFLKERGFRQDSPIEEHDDVMFVRQGL